MAQILIMAGATLGTVVKPFWVLTAAVLAAVADVLFSGRW